MGGEDQAEGKVRILSDLHLGHPACVVQDVRDLAPLLEGAEVVIFNGDTLEQTVKAWAVRGREQLAELRALCGELGVRPHFLVGNHDPYLEGNGWKDLCGGRVFVTHGDLILPEVAPWNREYLARKKKVWQVIREFGSDVSTLEGLQARARLVEEATIPDEVPDFGRKGGSYLWSALWPPMRLVNMLWAWTTMYGKAHRFVEEHRPDSEVFLFGHFHRPGLRKRGGRIYCNLGAFMKGASPWVVDLEDGEMKVRAIVRDAEGPFRPGGSLGQFSLGESP
jgi:predicted phosphodiesterase